MSITQISSYGLAGLLLGLCLSPGQVQKAPMVIWLSLPLCSCALTREQHLFSCCLDTQNVSMQNNKSFCPRIHRGGRIPIHQCHHPKLCCPWTLSAVIFKTFSVFEPCISPWTWYSLPACKTLTPDLSIIWPSKLESRLLVLRLPDITALCSSPRTSILNATKRQRNSWARPALRLPQSHC